MTAATVMQPRQRRTADFFEQGFTLIEMIVALAILSISLGVLFAAFSQDMDQQRLSRSQISARILAQGLLEESAASAPLDPGVRRGIGPDGLTWTVSVVPFGTNADREAWKPAPAKVIATVQWSFDGRPQHITLTTLEFLRQGKSP